VSSLYNWRKDKAEAAICFPEILTRHAQRRDPLGFHDEAKFSAVLVDASGKPIDVFSFEPFLRVLAGAGLLWTREDHRGKAGASNTLKELHYNTAVGVVAGFRAIRGGDGGIRLALKSPDNNRV
jgi:hypothetical protein